MKMKQFFHLTFVFLILACLAHSVSALTEQDHALQLVPGSVEDNYIAAVYTR